VIAFRVKMGAFAGLQEVFSCSSANALGAGVDGLAISVCSELFNQHILHKLNY
jgi:hypothetical protein